MASRKAEIEKYVKMNDAALEQALAMEFGITNGIDVSGATDDRDRAKRLEDAISSLRKKISDTVDATQVKLKRVACERLKYCARRETAVEIFIEGLLDAGLAEFTKIPLPTVAIFVYVVKRRMLDRVCGC